MASGLPGSVLWLCLVVAACGGGEGGELAEQRAAPLILGVSAVEGPTAGEPRLPVERAYRLALDGREFRAPVRVFVDGDPATVVETTATRVLVTPPARDREGYADVELFNDDGASTRLDGGLFYTQEFSLSPQPDALTLEDAHHLLRRAGLGAAPGEAEAVAADGLVRTVDRLLTFTPSPATEAAAAADYASFPPREPVNRRTNQEWWLRLMLTNPNPLQERMALFLHDHFATNQGDFNDAAWFAVEQIQLFRREGLGNWRDLCAAVARDRAMLLWLDGVFSTRDAPNENFARELWELFMLGEGVGYEQKDIEAASRAFTGFKLRHNPGHFVTVEYLSERHDASPKTILGVTGRFGYAGIDPRDSDGGVVALTLARRGPEAARFLCRKLAAMFLWSDPPDEIVEPLAAQLRAADWELRPVLQRLLSSKALFSARARRAHVKNPLEFAVGFLRATGIAMPVERLNQRLIETGFSILEPPDVSGWPDGRAFTGAQDLLASINFLNEAVSHLHSPLTTEVDGIAAGLDVPLSPAARDEMNAYLERGPTDPVAKTRGLLYMMGQNPEAYRK